MKKSILFLGLMLCVAAITNAQVSFFVDSPADITGGYETLAADPGTDWSVPDMSDPANVIVGEMCMGTDSLACEALTNGADLVGKIAVVYRGACEFGFKALQAQNEGAIACIIVNHSPGVVPMGGGADGISVTIPVIMVSNSTGSVIHDAVAACNGASATIGNLNGFFENNLRLTKGGVLRSSSYGLIAALNTTSDEFSIETGAWVYNFGQSEETAGVLNLNVDFGGSSIYSENSDDLTIPVGDSVFVMLPTFIQDNYSAGDYDMNYTVSGTGEDGFTADNISPALFELGDVFSYARLNSANQANPTNYTSPATVAGAQNYCIMFEDPNASEIAIQGFSVTGTHFTETIADFDIEISVNEWLDADEGLGTGFEDFNQLDSEGYTFSDGDDDALIIINFDEPIELEDDVRYAFCITHENDGLQLGYDNNTDYTQTVELNQRPIFPFWDDAESFPLLFGADLAPAISVNTTDFEVGVDEISNKIDITPYPNPANEYVNIPFPTEYRGNATINIMNLQGQLVSAQQENVYSSFLEVDVAAIANGTYVFNVVFANGKQSTFNVVVNR
ncbi:MAG: hypothetical protein ACI8XB_000420 [Patiriisocius sp.]|jgi:hypothetical protein